MKEYFLFDPFEDYLDPPMQGYRLRKGEYVPIKPVDGRLPSQVTGLHLERAGSDLRLWNPDDRPTVADAGRGAVRRRRVGRGGRRRAEAEIEHLRREIEELRRRNGR